jgi:hypothetical protein
MRKRMTSYNFYCCVEGCEKIRNGQSQYCISHRVELDRLKRKKDEKKELFYLSCVQKKVSR